MFQVNDKVVFKQKLDLIIFKVQSNNYGYYELVPLHGGGLALDVTEEEIEAWVPCCTHEKAGCEYGKKLQMELLLANNALREAVLTHDQRKSFLAWKHFEDVSNALWYHIGEER